MEQYALAFLGTIAYMEDSTAFLPLLHLRLVAFSRPSPRSSPSSWPGTAPFTLLPPGNLLPRWKVALAQEAVRGVSSRPLVPCGILASRFCLF